MSRADRSGQSWARAGSAYTAPLAETPLSSQCRPIDLSPQGTHFRHLQHTQSCQPIKSHFKLEQSFREQANGGGFCGFSGQHFNPVRPHSARFRHQLVSTSRFDPHWFDRRSFLARLAGTAVPRRSAGDFAALNPSLPRPGPAWVRILDRVPHEPPYLRSAAVSGGCCRAAKPASGLSAAACPTSLQGRCCGGAAGVAPRAFRSEFRGWGWGMNLQACFSLRAALKRLTLWQHTSPYAETKGLYLKPLLRVCSYLVRALSAYDLRVCQ